MKAAVIALIFVVATSAVLAAPQQVEKKSDRGSVGVDVHREKGVGTVVRGQGEANVWKSRDGNTRVDAHGQWSRVYNGPAAGKPNYSGGIRLEHRFRRDVDEQM